MDGNIIVNMLLQRNPGLRNNPMIQNAFKMAQNNDVSGLQSLARNIGKTQNVDVDEVLKNVTSQFGIK